MNKILSWLKPQAPQEPVSGQTQKFIDIKRSSTIINFIHPGHPLYDNVVAKEENKLRILAPNETAYSENSLLHKFVAIAIYKGSSYLIVNSLKHYKEQSIGGLLQFDENIYNIIPFFENETEYQTAGEYTFRETYEYDHPVESYAFLADYQGKSIKISLERGKQPLTIKMIDQNRKLFTSKLSARQIEIIDYIIMPAINAYASLVQKHKIS